MAQVNNTYKITVSINDRDLDYAPSNYSFTLKDSIYDFYPTGNFVFNDIRGLFNEVLTFIEGTKIEITYGTLEEYFTCPFMIIKNSIPDQSSAGGFGGMSENSLIHNYFSTQSKKSTSYQDEISNIIKKLTSSFIIRHIDTTLNKGYWYQPLLNDVEFMNQLLLPFAYNSTSKKTPFFLFINSNNELYFQSYNSLLEQNIIQELNFVPKGSNLSSTKDSIQSFFPYQTPLSEIRNSLHQLLYNFTKEGTSTFIEDIITQYKSENTNIPLTWDINNITNYYELYSEDVEDIDIKNNNLGLQYFNIRNMLTFDKAIVSCNLNKNLVAGKKVKLFIPLYSDPGKEDLSIRYSGEYLIESSYHTWNSRSGNTILVISKPNGSLPDTYLNKAKLL